MNSALLRRSAGAGLLLSRTQLFQLPVETTRLHAVFKIILGYQSELKYDMYDSKICFAARCVFAERVNGDRYEGEWRNGRMHGKGVKVMANGDVYNGTWENDKAEGNGVKVGFEWARRKSRSRLCIPLRLSWHFALCVV